jgi:hypothetical protein
MQFLSFLSFFLSPLLSNVVPEIHVLEKQMECTYLVC